MDRFRASQGSNKDGYIFVSDQRHLTDGFVKTC